jgi:hypothetical protein
MIGYVRLVSPPKLMEVGDAAGGIGASPGLTDGGEEYEKKHHGDDDDHH